MSIYEQLYPWQKKLVDKFKNRDRIGLFLDMGTGKTPISLAFAEQNRCEKILIITINSKSLEGDFVKGSWRNWINKSNIGYTIYNKKTNDNYCEKSALIVNYESLYTREKQRIKKKKVELKENIINFINSCQNQNITVIIDESHKIKDLQSLQTLAITKIIKQLMIVGKKTHVYLLTGTSFTVGYIDLYSQLKLLGCNLTKSEFIDKFCILGNIRGLLGWQQPIIGYKNLDELYDLIHQYAITIKSEDIVDLPEQIFVDHVLPQTWDFNMLTQEKVRGYDILTYMNKEGLPRELNDNRYATPTKINNPFYRNLAYPDEKWIADTTGSFWLRCRQASIGFQGNGEECRWFNEDRINQLKNLLANNKDNYVIFYNYVPELLELYNVCEELGYNIDIYCGEIKSLLFYEKYQLMSDSQKLANKNNVIISNFASGSTGMNWQEYNKCILFSLPLYKDYAQGIKRIHRTGQKQTTYYHIFYQNNFLDKRMKDSLEKGVDYNEKMFIDDINDLKEK